MPKSKGGGLFFRSNCKYEKGYMQCSYIYNMYCFVQYLSGIFQPVIKFFRENNWIIYRNFSRLLRLFLISCPICMSLAYWLLFQVSSRNSKSQTCREAGTESHGSQETAGLPLKVTRFFVFQVICESCPWQKDCGDETGYSGFREICKGGIHRHLMPGRVARSKGYAEAGIYLCETLTIKPWMWTGT